MHLGHYFGTLANRVQLQRADHDVLVVVTDYQVIADRDHPDDVARVVIDIVLDYLATRQITFEPNRRPEVANLVRIAALCAGRDPVALAEEIGGGGGAALKRVVVDSVSAFLAPIRERRALYDDADARRVLEQGALRAGALADETRGRCVRQWGWCTASRSACLGARRL
jgi:tryptophanyl-tRNA synthetase